MSKLLVSEVFYSIQGEGITMGIPAVFVRLSGCNLMCGGFGTDIDRELYNGATWRCDTLEVWKKGERKEFDQILTDECIQGIKNNAHLVITGGEPLLQTKMIEDFIDWVRININSETFVEIETNGSIIPSDKLIDRVDLWNVSPKLSNSGNDQVARFNEKALLTLHNLTKRVQFKFVVDTEDSMNEILSDFRMICDLDKMVFMPSGENQTLLNKHKELVISKCKELGVRFSTRLHIDIWNQKTGI